MQINSVHPLAIRFAKFVIPTTMQSITARTKMNNSPLWKSRTLGQAALLALLLASPVHAGNATWTGGAGDNNWATAGTGGNWNPTVVPGVSGTAAGNTDVATFSTTGATVTDSVTNRELGEILFSNAGSLGSFTIGTGSNTIYFNANGTTGNIVETGTTTTGLTETIASNLMATGATNGTNGDIRIVTADGFSGTLKLSGTISTTATTGTSLVKVVSGGTGTNNGSNLTWISGIISDGSGGGKVAVSHGRNGILLLSGANTYSGGFTQGSPDVAASTTQIGVDSVLIGGALVSSAFGVGTVTFEGGTVESNGTANRTIYNSLTFSSSNTTGVYVFGDSTNKGTLTFTPATNAGTVAMGSGTNIGDNIQTNSNVVIADVLSGTTPLLKSGTATLTLSGANTYSVGTTIQGGVLSVASINNDSNGTQQTTSNLGKPSSIAAGTLVLGAGSTTGTLQYTGVGEITDRVITLGGSTGGGTIDQEGTGALKFTGAVTSVVSGGSGKTLTLTGPSTASTGELGGVISDAATTATAKPVSTVSNSATVIITNASTFLGVGSVVSGAGISGSPTVTAISGNTVTLSSAISAATTANLTFTGVSSPTSLIKTGTGSWIVSNNNSYSGGTTVSGGSLYISNAGGASYTAPTSSSIRTITATNGTGSATGTGAVTVQSGGTLAGSGTIASSSGGIEVKSGGTLSSGGIQAGTSAGQGLTINNAANLSSALLVDGGSTLSFALGSTTPYNGGSGALNFGAPNTNSTYLSLTGTTTDLIFANTTTADNINLTDLTNGVPSSGVSLTLRSQNPYLLIQTDLGNNADFANLMTSGGLGQNGIVTGVSNGSGGFIAFNINAYDLNGNLISSPNNLENLQLYLFNGDLEVVPEPGSWALILAGLGVLAFWQRRKSQVG